MISLPKPKFAETNVPIGISKDDYKNEIIDLQAHVLKDAIDRVSFRDFFFDETISFFDHRVPIIRSTKN